MIVGFSSGVRTTPSVHYGLMPRVLTWDGKTLPKELRKLPAGRYAILPLDRPPRLTAEQEHGLREAIASLDRGEGIAADKVHAELEELLKQRRRTRRRK